MSIHSHPTNSEVQRIEKDIRSLRDSGNTDLEIRTLLGLELRTWQKYNKRINEEDQRIWLSITQEQLGTELLRLRSSLEYTYRKALELAQSKTDTEEILEALQAKDDARLSIVHLLSEVPDFIRKIQPAPQPNKTTVQVTKYEEEAEWRERGEKVRDHEE